MEHSQARGRKILPRDSNTSAWPVACLGFNAKQLTVDNRVDQLRVHEHAQVPKTGENGSLGTRNDLTELLGHTFRDRHCSSTP